MKMNLSVYLVIVVAQVLRNAGEACDASHICVTESVACTTCLVLEGPHLDCLFDVTLDLQCRGQDTTCTASLLKGMWIKQSLMSGCIISHRFNARSPHGGGAKNVAGVRVTAGCRSLRLFVTSCNAVLDTMCPCHRAGMHAH